MITLLNILHLSAILLSGCLLLHALSCLITLSEA